MKTLPLAAAILLFASLGMAQNREQHGSGQRQVAPAPQRQQQPSRDMRQARPDRHEDRRPQPEVDRRDRGNRDVHQDRDRGHDRDYHSDRRHYPGREYHRPYFHHYRWGRGPWHGPRFFVGSSFYWGSYWFVIVEPVPSIWDEDDYVSVIWIDGVPYLINDRYPGMRILIRVY